MRTDGNDKGFTLVEVLVALTVTALLLTAVYRTVGSATAARERLAVENARHHMARIAFERIGRELESLHFVADDGGYRFSGGIDGGDTELLGFTSTASTPLATLPGVPARISYRLEAIAVGGRTEYRIHRVESSSLAMAEGRPYRLADGLSAVEIRFLSGGRWVDRWDSQATQAPPEAVALTLRAGGNDATVFRTTWRIGEAP